MQTTLRIRKDGNALQPTTPRPVQHRVPLFAEHSLAAWKRIAAHATVPPRTVRCGVMPTRSRFFFDDCHRFCMVA